MQIKPETGCYILNIIALTQQSNKFFKIGLWGYHTSKNLSVLSVLINCNWTCDPRHVIEKSNICVEKNNIIFIFWKNCESAFFLWICINKETLCLLVSQAGRFFGPLCLTHFFPCQHFTSSWDLSTVGAGSQNLMKICLEVLNCQD